MSPTHQSHPRVDAVVAILSKEFQTLAPTVLTTTVRESFRDLEGQVRPGALEEMSWQLARHRLTELRRDRAS